MIVYYLPTAEEKSNFPSPGSECCIKTGLNKARELKGRLPSRGGCAPHNGSLI